MLSVVICTYNRSSVLKGCLDSFADQTAGRNVFDVIIVDNNSSDDTKQICSEYVGRYDNFHYTVETKQGISHARNAGWQLAKGDFVCFVDDDARADKDYIKLTSETLKSLPGNVIAIGGPILPFYLDEKPNWFKDEYEIIKLRNDSGYLQNHLRLFSGSNMIIKKSELERSEGFNKDLGMKADILDLGEETQLFRELTKLNNNRENLYYYSSNLVIYHLVPEYKFNPGYILKRKMFSAIKKFMRFDDIFFIKIILIVKNFFQLIIYTAILILSLPFYKHYKSWLIERGTPVAKNIGFFIGLFKIRLKIKNN